MSRQRHSRTPYRCRPCSERTGQVIYRAGHKCPIQAAPVPILPDQPFDLSAIFLTPELSEFSPSGILDIVDSIELPSSAPVVDDVADFGTLLSFLLLSQYLRVYWLWMKQDFPPVRVICQLPTHSIPFILFIMTCLHLWGFLFIIS